MTKNNPKFSIIIPVIEMTDYIRESLPYLLNQSYEDFEILIFPHEKKETFKDKRIKVVASGKVGPAEKRDLALIYAQGEILVFIDDDAYPNEYWLESALKNFQDEKIGAVGGPNLTPKNSSKFQKASGFALSSAFVSGGEGYRNKIAKKREIVDCPSSNLFVRKKIFEEIGGFDSEYYPGEDTKLCLEIIKLGWKIIYDPRVFVYHHRRKNLNGYLKQVFSFSQHRGYFAKKLPETSLKLQYFIPTLFLGGIFVGFLFAILHEILSQAYLGVWGLYFVLTFFVSLEGRLKGISFFRTAYIIFLTHVIYGLGFFIGIFKKDLKSKFRG